MTFKSEVMEQASKLRRAMDVDYKEIKNMFAECQDQINEEAKWVSDFRGGLEKVQGKVFGAEKAMFAGPSGQLVAEKAYETKVLGSRLVGQKEFAGF